MVSYWMVGIFEFSMHTRIDLKYRSLRLKSLQLLVRLSPSRSTTTTTSTLLEFLFVHFQLSFLVSFTRFVISSAKTRVRSTLTSPPKNIMSNRTTMAATLVLPPRQVWRDFIKGNL